MENLGHAVPILSSFVTNYFHGIIDCCKDTLLPNFKLLSITGVIFTSIRLRENWLKANLKFLVRLRANVPS